MRCPRSKGGFTGGRQDGYSFLAVEITPSARKIQINLQYFQTDNPSVDVIVTTPIKNVGSIFWLEAEAASIGDEIVYPALTITLAKSYVAATPRLRADTTQDLPGYRRRRRELLDPATRAARTSLRRECPNNVGGIYDVVERYDPQTSQLLTMLGWLNCDDILSASRKTGKIRQ